MNKLKSLLFAALAAASVHAQSIDNDILIPYVNAAGNAVSYEFISPLANGTQAIFLYDGTSGVAYPLQPDASIVFDLTHMTLGVNPAVLPAAHVFNNSATKTLVTSSSGQGGVVLDASRDTIVNYSVNSSITTNIGGTSTVTVYLEIAATNSATPSDWTTISQASNGNTISLAIALQSVQPQILNVGAVVPAGSYVRIRYTLAGTSSATYGGGQEVKL